MPAASSNAESDRAGDESVEDDGSGASETEPGADATPEPTATPTPTTTDPAVDVDQLTTPDEAVPAPEPVELSPAAFPRTVDHPFGTTEIPQAPQRILATAGVTDLDALISLGVVPYATSLYFPVNTAGDLGLAAWNAEYEGQIVALPREATIEEYARIEPDLIVGQGPGFLTDDLDLFAEIAPVVVHDYPTEWKDPILLFGEALGLEAEAEAAIERIQGEIDTIAERVPDEPPSIAMVSPFGDQLTIYNESLGAGPARALASIGLEIVGPDGPISYERIGDLADAEWIIVFDFTLGPVDEFLENPIFNTLPAVQAGNVVRLSPEQSFSWVIETSRSLPATLDGILTQLEL